MSRTPRIYVEGDRIEADELLLEGDLAHRLSSVLRMRPGDGLTVFDGRGREREASVRELARGRVALTLLADVARSPEPPVPVTLVCAFPRGQRGDWIAEKATELGAACIVPFAAGRSVLDPGDGRTARWRRLAIEAAEQCGRAVVPVVGGPPPEADLVLLADPGARSSVREALADHLPGSVAVYIGPEGGWSDAERDDLAARGAIAVTLGPRVLRVETAAVVALAQVVEALEAHASAGAARS
jgi:16S rRNA (uracil1498-N3)-methyltransferase